MSTNKIMGEAFTRDNFLARLTEIKVPETEAAQRAAIRWQHIADANASMGQLAILHQRLAGVLSHHDPDLVPRASFIFAADNGITLDPNYPNEEGATASDLEDIIEPKSCLNLLSRAASVKLIPVNLGVRDFVEKQGILNLPVRAGGSSNFISAEAMTEEEMMLALRFGFELATAAAGEGYQLLSAASLGRANNDVASTVLAVLENVSVSSLCSRNEYISNEALMQKEDILRLALKEHKLLSDDPLTVLRTVGSFDLTAILGFYAGAILAKRPLLVDGLPALTAALILCKLRPQSIHYFFALQAPSDAASELAFDSMALTAITDLRIADSSGSGALLAYTLLDKAVLLYREANPFEIKDNNSFKLGI